MKIEIKFTADRDDDADQFPGLGGKTVTMEHATELDLSASTDIFPDGNGGKVAGESGALDLKARGQRAMWSE